MFTVEYEEYELPRDCKRTVCRLAVSPEHVERVEEVNLLPPTRKSLCAYHCAIVLGDCLNVFTYYISSVQILICLLSVRRLVGLRHIRSGNWNVYRSIIWNAKPWNTRQQTDTIWCLWNGK